MNDLARNLLLWLVVAVVLALAFQNFYFFFGGGHSLGGGRLGASGGAAEEQQRGKKQQIFHGVEKQLKSKRNLMLSLSKHLYRFVTAIELLLQ